METILDWALARGLIALVLTIGAAVHLWRRNNALQDKIVEMVSDWLPLVQAMDERMGRIEDTVDEIRDATKKS